MGTIPENPDARRPRATMDDVVAELRANREELRLLRRLFDEFAGVHLKARFPYGKPVDRWASR